MFYHYQILFRSLLCTHLSALQKEHAKISRSSEIDHCTELFGWIGCLKKQKLASLFLDNPTWANLYFALLCELIILPGSPTYDLEIAVWKLTHKWKNKLIFPFMCIQGKELYFIVPARKDCLLRFKKIDLSIKL